MAQFGESFAASGLLHIAAAAIGAAIAQPEEGVVFAGCNVTDREDDWMQNYRCPDVAVFLKGNPA